MIRHALAGAPAFDPEAQREAYLKALTKLAPVWKPLPLAPYPPADDDSGFPRTGDPLLIISASKFSQAQLNEPALATKNLYDQSVARRPKPNAFFFVGLACLAGYWLVRR